MATLDDVGRARTRIAWPALLGALLALGCSAAASDIYRYQDAYGNWHFTDDPPPGVDADIIPDIKTGTARRPLAPAPNDLAARLEAAFDTVTPIARASLAVVAIRGPGGTGSGFFCSAEGYILTDRRLLEGDSEALGAAPAASDERGALAEEAAAGRERLKRMEKDLEGYARVLKNAEDETARAWAEGAHAELAARHQAERDALAALELELSTRVGESGGSGQDGGRPPLIEAGVAKVDLYLKDGTALHASIVDDADLGVALLKLDGYRTPALSLDADAALAEGMRVFAVGRAAGLQDAITSGTVTEVGANEILTDADPLPGQDGGPLIDQDGRVVGVLARADGMGETAAQGRAIPALLIRRDLPGACR